MEQGKPFDFEAQFGGKKPDFKKVAPFFKKLWIIGLLVLLFIARPWAIVDPGYRGVKVRLGSVQPGPLDEGIHAIIPFMETVVQMEVRINKEESSASAASKDLQTVSSKVTVNYHPDPAAVDQLFQKVGLSYGPRIIAPAVQEVVKAISAQYTAEELITKRPMVKDMIREQLTTRLATHNIIVDDISITDFDFSKSFNDAIEAKQVAEQNVQKAQRDLQRIEVEAKQKIAQAGAEASALRLQRQEISPDLLKLREIENQKLAIEKWNGVLPQVTGESTPLINIAR